MMTETRMARLHLPPYLQRISSGYTLTYVYVMTNYVLRVFQICLARFRRRPHRLLLRDTDDVSFT